MSILRVFQSPSGPNKEQGVGGKEDFAVRPKLTVSAKTTKAGQQDSKVIAISSLSARDYCKLSGQGLEMISWFRVRVCEL